MRIVSAFLWVMFFLTSAFKVEAQTIIKGHIITNDGEDAPNIRIFIKGQNVDTMATSDENGNYFISFEGKADSAIFVALTYQKIAKPISSDTLQIIDVTMQAMPAALNEVVVTKKKRTRYRNKDNPAVELIRQVIAHKENNRLSHYDSVSYHLYEKLQIGTSNTPPYISRLPILRRYRFLFQNIDSTSIPNKKISPIYLQETISDEFRLNKNNKHKSIVRARKQVTFDSRYVEENVFNNYLKHLYQDVDIYNNDISLITNSFLSPIANTGPSFYKYWITDTIENDGIQLIQLDYEPRNKKDFLFYGTLYITLDGNYGVQNAELIVGKNVNLNWISDLRVDLDFKKANDGHYYLARNNSSAFFSMMNGKRGMYASRTIVIDSFNTSPILPINFDSDTVRQSFQIDSAIARTDSFWKANRPEALTHTEATTYKNLDSLIHMKSFKRLMSVGNMLATGYLNLHQVELGPIYSLYSKNNLEGVRTRFGGRTTDELSKRFFAEGYAAYGFKDQQVKYLLRGTVSFNKKNIYTFPRHYLRIGYQHDVMVPGQEFQYSDNDNFLISFQRGNNQNFVYFNNIKFEYLFEFGNIMNIGFKFSHQDMKAAGALSYVRFAGTNAADTVARIINSDFGFEWSWSPNRDYVQRRYYRTNLPNKYPTLTLNANFGIKGLAGSEYDYQSLRLSLDKRFFLSQLGYAQMRLRAGYLFGSVPYPLLNVPVANQSYLYQLNAYNLMNYFEFVSDQYASLFLDYHMMGFILNKIPLIKKLNLRETFNFKVLYAGLRKENDPAYHPELFAFPVDSDGQQLVNKFGKEPYIEAAIGIENILNLFRIDVVRRFTYLNHRDANKWGVRATFSLDF